MEPNGPAARATPTTLSCKQDATTNDLSHMLFPQEHYMNILATGTGTRNPQLSGSGQVSFE